MLTDKQTEVVLEILHFQFYFVVFVLIFYMISKLCFRWFFVTGNISQHNKQGDQQQHQPGHPINVNSVSLQVSSQQTIDKLTDNVDFRKVPVQNSERMVNDLFDIDTENRLNHVHNKTPKLSTSRLAIVSLLRYRSSST
jgi:hypothetical protein